MFPFDPKTVDRKAKLGVRRPQLSAVNLRALGLLRDTVLAQMGSMAPLAQLPPEERRLIHEAALFITFAKLHHRGLHPKRPALTDRVVRGLSLMVEQADTLNDPTSRLVVRWVRQAEAWRKAYDYSRKAVTQ